MSEKCRQKNPDLIVIIMTAYATIESLSRRSGAGAYEYIVKPVVHDEAQSPHKKSPCRKV